MALYVKAEVMNIKLQIILIPKIIFYPEVMEAIQSEAVIWVYYLMGSLEDQVRFKVIKNTNLLVVVGVALFM